MRREGGMRNGKEMSRKGCERLGGEGSVVRGGKVMRNKIRHYQGMGELGMSK
jgi:hypothetical protein